MRIKIGDTWYDSSQIPIAIALTNNEKGHIQSLPEGPNGVVYANGPMDQLQWTTDELRAWTHDQLTYEETRQRSYPNDGPNEGGE